MGDRIVVLDKGKIQQVAAQKKFIINLKNKFVAGFIGQMNFIETVVQNGKITIEGAEFDLPFEFHSDKLTIGIRAENMICGDKAIFVNTDIIEMSGSERIVYFELNGSKMFCKNPAGV